MAVEQTPDPVRRASELARATEPAGLAEVAEGVKGRVRRLVTPATPVELPDAAAPDGSRTFLSSRVLAAELRRALQGVPTHAPQQIELRIEDTRLRGIHVELVCAYGTPLHALAGSVRKTLLAQVAALLGPGSGLTAEAVTVHVADVTAGDPNLV